MVLKPSIHLSGFADKDYCLYWIISQELAKVGPELALTLNEWIKNNNKKTLSHPLAHLLPLPTLFKLVGNSKN